MSYRIIATIESAYVGNTNQAQISFRFSAGVIQEGAARVAAYVRWLGTHLMNGDCTLRGLNSRAIGDAGGIDLPFPTAEYTALRAAAGDPNGWYPVYDYGVVFGTGDTLPFGTSVLVNERTALLGRRGRGRVFLPYPREVVNAGGLLDPGAEMRVRDGYNAFILRQDVDGAPNASDIAGTNAVILSNNGVTNAITSCQVRPVFSSLRSRRR